MAARAESLMRILIVEDHAPFADALAGALEQAVPAAEVAVAASTEAAIKALDTHVFDFILCDLQLPPADGSSDLQIAHGRNVVTTAMREAPGTPVLVLSAFADKFENLKDLVARAGREDVHGNSQAYTMVDAEVKDRVDEAIDTVRAYAAQLEILADIDVRGVDETTLEPWEIRVLRIFGRRAQGRVVAATRLGGGLSSSHTYRVEVFDNRHDRRASVVAKLDTIDAVRDERDRLQHEIAPRLTEGTYAPYADAVTGGYGRYGGLFCKLLDGFGKPLLDLLEAGDPTALTAIQGLRALSAPWLEDAPWDTVKVGVIRRAQIDDGDLAAYRRQLSKIGSASFEERLVQVRSCTQHQDLHGLNVLMRGDTPQIVDYARVGASYGGTDAVALELSLAFHPSIRSSVWPTIESARAWADPAKFAAGSPFEDVIVGCRTWAEADAGSPRAICAMAYAWALRQLKFDGVRTDIALEIAHAAIRAFDD